MMVSNLKDWDTVSIDFQQPAITVFTHKKTGAVLYRIGIAGISVELDPDEALAFWQELECTLERWSPEVMAR